MNRFYKIGYYLCIALTILVSLLTVGSLIVVLLPDENTVFEASELIVPAICLVLSIMSFILVKVLKKKG